MRISRKNLSISPMISSLAAKSVHILPCDLQAITHQYFDPTCLWATEALLEVSVSIHNFRREADQQRQEIIEESTWWTSTTTIVWSGNELWRQRRLLRVGATAMSAERLTEVYTKTGPILSPARWPYATLFLPIRPGWMTDVLISTITPQCYSPVSWQQDQTKVVLCLHGCRGYVPREIYSAVTVPHTYTQTLINLSNSACDWWRGMWHVLRVNLDPPYGGKVLSLLNLTHSQQ